MTRAPAPRGAQRTHDVIVIGAGFAGLSAAVALADAGARVLVLERRPRLGGRATSYRDAATGESVDNGQHVLFGCYRETWRFLRRVGADRDVRLAPSLAVESIDVDGERTRLDCPHLPAPFSLAAGVLEWDRVPASERWAALRMLGAVRAERARLGAGGAWRARLGAGAPREPRDAAPRGTARADETVRDWLVRLGQGPRLRHLLWEPLALAALNQRPEQAAAPPFARVLAELCGPGRTDAAIGVPARPLAALYAEPARRFVEARGGSVRTQTPATVRFDGEELRGVAAGETLLRAEAVIAAVPWHALPGLLPDRPDALAPVTEAARATPGSPIVSVNLWVDRPLLASRFVGLPGRTMQWAFETAPGHREARGLGEARGTADGCGSGTGSGRRPAGARLTLVASGADDVAHLPNPRIVARAAADLRDALPDRGWRIEHASVIREPRATFSLAPGQPRRPGTETPVPGLLLAGDWIDTGLPGTIESAVVSGHRAAEAALARLA
ncbi:MAG: FAD-dependent oxidoreductase [Acidobacteria bacterium]|nr:FAD-dependent oxidoreductase [Acidobacteriota bacterium]